MDAALEADLWFGRPYRPFCSVLASLRMGSSLARSFFALFSCAVRSAVVCLPGMDYGGTRESAASAFDCVTCAWQGVRRHAFADAYAQFVN